MRTIAPAKINWTLEVIGKRPDGYHEIRSVMQTIDLCDELWAEPSDKPRFETVSGEPLTENDLIVRAAGALEERTGRDLPATIRVQKRIPVASGLGGGSSDAAATLRLLNELYGISLSNEDLAAIGGEVGSDVPFFVYGGTALVEARGERVMPLPDAATTWLVLVSQPIGVPEKTKRMYEALTVSDFSSGAETHGLATNLQEGKRITGELLHNSFGEVVYRVYPQLNATRWLMHDAGATSVHVVGSGPALFSFFESEEEARRMAHAVQDGVMQVLVGRTLGAAEATAVVE
jgi:4-diphosphocytidyl-2-C-methyl-D-erythritol kinase